ncbi:MAG TPA: dihydrodipicolinate synthase family protein [Actinomycetes bacterium]|nr:dihydrodipicolinate synthase family protein [Actinomycetes bacterium]
MTQPLFTGVAVALVTLFDDAGEVDAKATADHAATLVDLGVRAVVVAGSTGEAATLAPEERIAVLAAVRQEVPSGTPVLAGTGAPSRRQAAALTRDAVEHGADGLLVLSPPGSADLRGYYETVVAAAGAVPVLAYHFPVVSAPGIPVEALGGLPVRGLKDSSGDPNRLLAERSSYTGWLYVGAASVLALAGPLGCDGAILALANAEPERCSAAFAGDAEAQLALAEAHMASQRDFPHGLKALVAERFGTSRAGRLG